MFAATTLRAYLIYKPTPAVGRVLFFLGIWLLLLLGNIWLSRRFPWSTIIFLSLETGIVLYGLLDSGQDFLAFLFAIISMQAMQQYSPRLVVSMIALFAVMTYFSLVDSGGALQALAFSLIYPALCAFMAAYIWSTRRAEVIEKQQQSLVGELEVANRQLESQARQQEQLVAVHERQRLARELHDSVTQTIFSMTLTTQSALLLLERDRTQVSAQLDRLDQLAQSAQGEMQVLISQLAPPAGGGGSFVSSLQKHLEERQRLNNLSVELDLTGSQPLEPAEEAGLFRIAQEALNNIVKHAGVSQAVVRLHLAEPFWMEIEDCGAGFDPQNTGGSGKMGLAGMRERAAEIGWSLEVVSSPGKGTRIRIERKPAGEG